MSVKVMSMVFERYHEGGGEMLLALALADHAHDDGTNVFPSVQKLSEKTRQSERTVQYQLRRMEECGWLVLVSDENGGRGKARNYRISEDWINGAEIAPIKNDEKRVQSTTERVQSTTERVQSEAEKGAIAVAPESSYNHQLTIIKPSVEKNNKKENSNKTKAPEKFEVTMEMFDEALRIGIPEDKIELETESFLAHAKAKGSKYVNWKYAWKNWMLNAMKWTYNDKGKGYG